MEEPVSDRLILDVEAVIAFELVLKDSDCESVGTLEFTVMEEADEIVATPEETAPSEDKADTDIEADADVVTSPLECSERLLATCAAIWSIACARTLSPAAVAVPELAEILLDSVASLLLLRLAVLLAIVFAAGVAPAGPATISVPSTKRSSAASADTT